MSFTLTWFIGAPVAGAGILAAAILPLRRPRLEATAIADGPGDALPIRRRVAAATAVAAPLETVEREAQDGDIVDEIVTEGNADSDSIALEPVAVAEEVEPPSKASFFRRIFSGASRTVRREAAEGVAAVQNVVDDAIEELDHYADTREVRHAEGVASAVATIQPPVEMQLTPVRSGDHVHSPHENGIIDLEGPPEGVSQAEWEAQVGERERLLRLQYAQREAEAAAAHRVQIEADVERERIAHEEEVRIANEQSAQEALNRQRELENIAIEQETRSRADARNRRWFMRLDLDLEAPTRNERMALASSLGVVSHGWAEKMLCEVFDTEEDAHVRARVVGALVSAGHLDHQPIFQRAIDNDGIERVATIESLYPRKSERDWIPSMLAPFCVE